jgi:membrane protein DedA with SNARE-associated domain
MIEWVTGVIAQAGLPGVFALMFAENLFPPVPSEVIMPLACFVAARGQMSFPGAILAGVLGTVAGNAVWYELARRVGAERVRRLLDRHGRWAAVNGEDMRKAERAMRRWGPAAVFVARLLPGIRTVISLPAGLARIPRHTFYLWTTLGSALWVSVLAGAGWVLKEQYTRVEGWLEPLSWAVLALVVGAYLRRILRAA